MMKTASRYAPNSIASSKKHIFARLLDYFLTFMVSLTLFAIALPISVNTRAVQNIVNDLSAARTELYQFIDSTTILHYNSEGTDLLSINDEATHYLKNLALTSAYVHDMGFPERQEDGTYLPRVVEKEETFVYDNANYPLDNISYYYRIFKSSRSELDDYNGKTYSELTPAEIDEYEYSYIMALTLTNYVEADDADLLARGEGVSRYVVLTVENTEQLLKYYKNDRNDTKLYNSIYGCYAKGLQKAIKEIEKYSLEYKTIEKEITKASRRFSVYQVVVYILCYTLAYAILNVSVSLASKEWTTCGLKVMKLAFCDTDEMEPPVWKMLLYHLVCYLGFFSSSLLAFLLLGNIGITSLTIFPHISFLMVLLFILPFNVVSIFLPLFNKKYRFDLATFFTRIVIKDKNEFDVPVGMDISDKVEDGQQY